MYHILFIHSSVDGYLGCFHLLAVMNNAALTVDLQLLAWTYVSFLLGTYLGVEILNQMVTLCNFLNCHRVFKSRCTILYSHHQCMGVLISSHTHQHLLLSDL